MNPDENMAAVTKLLDEAKANPAKVAEVLKLGAHLSTATHLQRLRSALSDTERFINREGRRDPAIRPADMQKTLDSYIQHRANLLAVMAELLKQPQ
ncbi:hypothetical protein [Paraburkholderia sp. GAS32]|uniref:hypothetical protein n=1 Tax=Paraburkholderia sp. GAS32 TaxID=3035129 RepID=UPI003D2314A0